MKRDDRAYVADVLLYARRVQAHVDGRKFDDLTTNAMLQDAIMPCFEIMGEATKRLSPEFRAENSEVNWAGMAGFRDVLAHAYESIDLEVCWKIINDDLPGTIVALERILSSEA